MSLTFPTNPTNGQLYPDPVLESFPQFQWNSTTQTWVRLDLSKATDTRAGIAEIATQNEVNNNDDYERIVTPKTLKAYVNDSTHFNARVTTIVNELGLGSILVVQSNSNHTLSNGTKEFLYDSEDQADFFIGQRLRVVHTTSNWMIGNVSAINPTTVTLVIDSFTGTGTYSSWTIGVSAGIDSYASETSPGLVQLASADVVKNAKPDDADPSPSLAQVVTAHKLAKQLANIPTLQITNTAAPTKRADETDLQVGDLWWKTYQGGDIDVPIGLHIYLQVPSAGEPLYHWVSVTAINAP
jgi:hypothetical protein